jgi:glycerol uptake facilitator-like aquaporin
VPANIRRRVAAEALGAGLLVATVVGSGIMAERLTGDVALALLCNTLPTGAILFVLITLFGPISGAHFNPAVSLAMAWQRALPWSAAGFYIGAQITGGIVGAAIAHVMFDAPMLALGDQLRTGPAQWLSEGVATFGLLLTILLGARLRPRAIPALVASYIVAAYWFTASTSFANPAVAIARAFTDTFSGIRPVDVPAFIAAQLAGAILAMAVSQWLLLKEQSA